MTDDTRSLAPAHHGVMVQGETRMTATANLADLEAAFPRNQGEPLDEYLVRAYLRGPLYLFATNDEATGPPDAYVLHGGKWVPA